MTRYHLFITQVEQGSEYIGTYDTPQAAYDAIASPGEVNARLFVTQDDGTLAQVAEFVEVVQQDPGDDVRVICYRWRFGDHDYEVDRKRFVWKAYPKIAQDLLSLATGNWTAGEWIESDPF